MEVFWLTNFYTLKDVKGQSSIPCGGVVTNPQSYIISPGYPNAVYEHNLVCVWEMKFTRRDIIYVSEYFFSCFKWFYDLIVLALRIGGNQYL